LVGLPGAVLVASSPGRQVQPVGTTRTGLRVRAELDASAYHTGVKVSDRQMDALPLSRHDWHGDWNYTPRPEGYDQAADVHDPFDRPSPDLAWLCHSALTGLSAQGMRRPDRHADYPA
jgi:Rhodopirellula transposase DDE domain